MTSKEQSKEQQERERERERGDRRPNHLPRGQTKDVLPSAAAALALATEHWVVSDVSGAMAIIVNTVEPACKVGVLSKEN